jgi:ankyrin repeat protein
MPVSLFSIDANNSSVLELLHLLDQGANVNEKDSSGYTMLFYSALYNRADLVQALIEKGIDVNAQNLYGSTALNYAFDDLEITDHFETVKVLLRGGADPNIQDSRGFTALMGAISVLDIDSAKELIRVSDVNLENSDGTTALTMACMTDIEDIAYKNNGNFEDADDNDNDNYNDNYEKNLNDICVI